MKKFTKTDKLFFESFLKKFGEDPTRPGLERTPERMFNSYNFLTSGYDISVDSVMNNAIFEENYDEMVLVKDIAFYSLCEHHVIPFFGKMHIAYIPKGKVIGLSKIPRVVEIFARRLQLQERLTQQVANSLMEYLSPYGVGVVCEAQHLCMAMRGVQKINSYTTTSAMEGIFKKDHRTRQEFLNLIKA